MAALTGDGSESLAADDGRPRRELGAVLDQLTAAAVPWLAIAATGCTARGALKARDATVIEIADPDAPPVMVNPLEPEPGFPVHAHAGLLAGLVEAAFGPADPVAEVIRAGLWRAYADCGWDAVTGAAPPGSVTPPAVPTFARLRHAAVAVAEDLGRGTRAAVRGFVQARLEPLWAGPAGRFLEGGHPADVGTLMRGNVLLAGGGLADDEAMSFLAGVVLVRAAERLCVRDGPPSARSGQEPNRPRFALVVASGGQRLEGSAWFDRLAREVRAHRAEVITTGPAPAAAAPAARHGGQTAAQVLRDRRSAACGGQCRRDRPCSGYELHSAGLIARDDERAWLRLWAQTLLLAFLTRNPLPHVPAGPLGGWRPLGHRSRECVLATVLDGAVTARAAALRRYYDPGRLLSVVAAVADRMLYGAVGAAGAAVPFRAGQAWVIPQLRWLHETERLRPLGTAPVRPDDMAPPLDFGLAGLPDWPGIRIRDRLLGLRRHPLSMASARNRRLARIALLGEDPATGPHADLDIAVAGIHPASRLRYAAGLMGAGEPGAEPGWLEVVLSWPDRIIRPAPEADMRLNGTG